MTLTRLAMTWTWLGNNIAMTLPWLGQNLFWQDLVLLEVTKVNFLTNMEEKEEKKKTNLVFHSLVISRGNGRGKKWRYGDKNISNLWLFFISDQQPNIFFLKQLRQQVRPSNYVTAAETEPRQCWWPNKLGRAKPEFSSWISIKLPLGTIWQVLISWGLRILIFPSWPGLFRYSSFQFLRLSFIRGHLKLEGFFSLVFQHAVIQITQRNTNRTASHESIFKIYILYEVISSLFALFCLCFLWCRKW